MDKIRYRNAGAEDDDTVRELIHAFYSNDQIDSALPDINITKTLEHLNEFPQSGSIILFENECEVIPVVIII